MPRLFASPSHGKIGEEVTLGWDGFDDGVSLVIDNHVTGTKDVTGSTSDGGWEIHVEGQWWTITAGDGSTADCYITVDEAAPRTPRLTANPPTGNLGDEVVLSWDGFADDITSWTIDNHVTGTKDVTGSSDGGWEIHTNPQTWTITASDGTCAVCVLNVGADPATSDGSAAAPTAAIPDVVHSGMYLTAQDADGNPVSHAPKGTLLYFPNSGGPGGNPVYLDYGWGPSNRVEIVDGVPHRNLFFDVGTTEGFFIVQLSDDGTVYNCSASVGVKVDRPSSNIALRLVEETSTINQGAKVTVAWSGVPDGGTLFIDYGWGESNMIAVPEDCRAANSYPGVPIVYDPGKSQPISLVYQVSGYIEGAGADIGGGDRQYSNNIVYVTVDDSKAGLLAAAAASKNISNDPKGPQILRFIATEPNESLTSGDLAHELRQVSQQCYPGDSLTLWWDLDSQPDSLSIGGKPVTPKPSGSLLVTPTANANYKLIARDADGNTSTAVVWVSMLNRGQPYSDQISVEPFADPTVKIIAPSDGASTNSGDSLEVDFSIANWRPGLQVSLQLSPDPDGQSQPAQEASSDAGNFNIKPASEGDFSLTVNLLDQNGAALGSSALISIVVKTRPTVEITFDAYEGLIARVDHDWHMDFIQIEAEAALKVSGSLQYKLDDGETAPEKSDLIPRINAGAAEVSNWIQTLPNVDTNDELVWSGQSGIDGFNAVQQGHKEGTIAEFVLYKGSLAVPGQEAAVEVTVSAAALTWDGHEAKVLVLPISIAADFPLIHVSVENGKIECDLEVEFSVTASIDTRVILGIVAGGEVAEVVGGVFAEITMPLLVVSIFADIFGGYIVAQIENSNNIDNALSIIAGFKSAFQEQLIASATDNHKVEPSDGGMAGMVQAQGIRNALNAFAVSREKLSSHPKIKDWVNSGVANGGNEADLANQAFHEFCDQTQAAAGDIAAAAYASGYNSIAQAMVNSMGGSDPVGDGVLEQQQARMYQKLGLMGGPKLIDSYDSYLAFYNKDYNVPQQPLNQRKEIPYTQDEWNALPTDQKSKYKPNPDYQPPLLQQPGMSDGPPMPMVKDEPGDPNYEEGVESYHPMDLVDYCDAHNAFRATLIVGDQRYAGRAMDVNVSSGTGTFLSDGGKLAYFSPPSRLDSMPDPKQKTAGVLDWNNPDPAKDKEYRNYVKGGHHGQLHLGGQVYSGIARMGGDQGVFVSDDGKNVISFTKPAYLTA